MKRSTLSLLLLLSMSSLRAADTDFPSPVLTQTAEHAALQVSFPYTYNYLLSLPAGYADAANADTRWRLLLFLHGLGERGDDLQKIRRFGPPKLIDEGKAFPFIVVSPQCPDDEWWNAPALEALLDEVARRYRVDLDRIYVTGLSMGGYGTWTLATRHPERYAAIIPICGGGHVPHAARLRDLPVWAFHGDADTAVPLSQSQTMIDAIKAAGGDPKFTVYPGVGHDSWTATYANDEIYAWLLSHRRRK